MKPKTLITHLANLVPAEGAGGALGRKEMDNSYVQKSNGQAWTA